MTTFLFPPKNVQIGLNQLFRGITSFFLMDGRGGVGRDGEEGGGDGWILPGLF